MKLLRCALPFFVFATSLTLAQVKAVPLGVRQADQTEAQTEKNVPPPIARQTHIDVAKLSHDADELARIAQTIPSDVSSMEKGLLPKDMIEKLREIEKLSKQLRRQLNP